jgi:hypothetical protein
LPAQRVLDPRQSLAEGSWTPPEAIPPALRNFGYFPDLSNLWPGDLLLFSSLKPSAGSKAIAWAQQHGGYCEEDARWHHAAVYVGAKIGICEANLHGVAAKAIYSYVGGHLLRARRDPHISREQGWEVAAHSLVRLHTKYSKSMILKLAQKAFRGYWERVAQSEEASGSVICSKLYSDAYSAATGKALRNAISQEITPAFLSQTPLLSDIALKWLKIG